MNAASQLAKEQKKQQTAQAMAAAQQGTAAGADANIDIGTLMQQAMAAGAGADQVQALIDRRVNKATATPGLEKYAYDDLTRQAMEYVANQKRQQVPDYTDLINQQYAAQKEADVAAIREAIRSAIANVNKSVSDALPQYGRLQRDSEVQRYSSQQALQEALANSGNLTGAGMSGAGRGEVLALENAAANRLTDIGLQKQKLQDDAAFSIAELQKSGSLQEAQAAAQAEQARIAALLQNASDMWNRNYQVGRDQVSDSRYDREWQYQQNRDEVSDSRYDREWEYQVQQNERDRLEQQAQTLAALGDFSGYEALGYSPAQIASMKAGYQAQLLAGASRKSSGSGGGGGDIAWATLRDSVLSAQDPRQALNELGTRYDISRTEYNDLLNAILDAEEKDPLRQRAVEDEARRQERIENAKAKIEQALAADYGMQVWANGQAEPIIHSYLKGMMKTGELAAEDEADEVVRRMGLW